MKLLANIKYQEEYIPPRCRKLRISEKEEQISVTLKEAAMQDLIPAFEIKGNIIYLYNSKLYRAATVQGSPSQSSECSPLDYLKQDLQRFGWYRSNFHDRSNAICDVESYIEQYLLVDGKVFQETNEPCYVVQTFGLGYNHGGTGLFADVRYSTLPEYAAFCALDRDLAVAYANKVARERGDTESMGHFTANIKVLLPEAVKFPRRSFYTVKVRSVYERDVEVLASSVEEAMDRAKNKPYFSTDSGSLVSKEACEVKFVTIGVE